MLDSKPSDLMTIGELQELIEGQRDNICSIPEENLAEYKKLLSELESSTTSKDNKVKGQALEKITLFLVKNIRLFKYSESNVFTSTNEIDVLCRFSPEYSCRLFPNGIFESGYSKYLLCECKNYPKKIGVTWVGKFASLVDTTPNCNVGVLFSLKGLAGRGKWDSSKGLVKKMFYKYSNDSQRLYLLDFDLKDFKRLASNRNFIEVLQKKAESLELDCKIEDITEHPAQDNINALLD